MKEKKVVRRCQQSILYGLKYACLGLPFNRNVQLL
uniref:Uncharacterized protein n=1 Tax=Arundo donax TaxID=35708 RepID=A0A0A8ZV86_ARUDO